MGTPHSSVLSTDTVSWENPRSRALTLIALIFVTPVAASAQVELSFYGGVQSAPLSGVSVRDRVIGDLTPYVGGGIGVAIPHVEVTNGASETFGYQLTGPAAT